ncbi:MAG TPA: hypothetical protein VEL31_30155 [Ktedonobacteraceae bacterium]|nr:hypothetical protein [Ktedonobacteraceae bacterium]
MLIGKAIFYLCKIKESVIFVTHQPRDLGSQQICDDGPVSLLTTKPDEGLTSSRLAVA